MNREDMTLTKIVMDGAGRLFGLLSASRFVFGKGWVLQVVSIVDIGTGRVFDFCGNEVAPKRAEMVESTCRILEAGGWPRSTTEDEPLKALEDSTIEADWLPVLDELEVNADE